MLPPQRILVTWDHTSPRVQPLGQSPRTTAAAQSRLLHLGEAMKLRIRLNLNPLGQRRRPIPAIQSLTTHMGEATASRKRESLRLLRVQRIDSHVQARLQTLNARAPTLVLAIKCHPPLPAHPMGTGTSTVSAPHDN